MASLQGTTTGHPSSPDDVPGRDKKLSTSLMETVASPFQSLKPLKKFDEHVCTWALYSQDLSRKIETHHHCCHVNEDFWQCVVFDTAGKDARLIGIEYILSEMIFRTLPEDEKKLWHSHHFEITSGLWANPGLPNAMAKPELKKLANSYGKFWLTWQYDRGDTLPLGLPALMMSPQDSEEAGISMHMINARDKAYHISTSDKYLARTKIKESASGIDPHADHWKSSGRGWALELKEVDALPGGRVGPVAFGESKAVL